MSGRIQILVAFLFVTLACAPIFGQQPRAYPPFTSTSSYTEYDAKGEIVSTTSSTRYESASGTWRSVSKVGDVELATLYRRGVGVYQSNSRTMRLIKESDHAPGCPIRTADELRADPTFLRTEIVLGFTAYVLRSSRTKESQTESYFVPELGGGTPFKQVSVVSDGRKVVSEPISVILGEPEAADVLGPDYLVVEEVPVFNQKLDSTVVSKPKPEYPLEALTKGLSGSVLIRVTVDETGHVLSATSRAFNGPRCLQVAAMEAAYQAVFTPTHSNGKAVPTSGMIFYQFDLPK